MTTLTATKSTTASSNHATAIKASVAAYIGKLFSFSNSLKLYHWHVSGKGSYAQHIALDQALESLPAIADRIAETSYAMYGDLDIKIPATNYPSDLVKHVEDFYTYTESQRKFFPETFAQAILDDCQETVQQLLYRLKRLQ